MSAPFSAFPRLMQGGLVSLCLIAATVAGYAQTPVSNDPPFYGPFNAVFLSGGDGLEKPLEKNDSVLRADSPWSLYGWVNPAENLKALTLVAGFGDAEDEYSRYLALDGQQVILWMGKDSSISSPAVLAPERWHFLAATFDGRNFGFIATARKSPAEHSIWGA